MIFTKIVEEYEGAIISLHKLRLFRRYEAVFEEYSIIFRADTLHGIKAVIDVEIGRQQAILMEKLKG